MLWADDLILQADSKGLQKQLDGQYSLCGRYQLIVNTLKTKVQIFGKEGRNKLSFSSNNGDIEICSSYKYLSVLFNNICDI